MRRHRSAKIVATLGPSSADEATVRALFETGVDVFRLNFSHASHAEHRTRHALVRAIEDAVGRPVGILADLQGPKLRIGTFRKGEVALVQGQRFTLVLGVSPGDEAQVPVPHPEIFAALAPGAEVLLDDGKVRLRVAACGPDHAETVVVTPGILSDRKGLNLPGVTLPIDAGHAQGSGRPRLRPRARRRLGGALLRPKAGGYQDRPGAWFRRTWPSSPSWKKPAALDCLEEVVALSDAIMVARGRPRRGACRPRRCRPRRNASFARHGRRASGGGRDPDAGLDDERHRRRRAPKPRTWRQRSTTGPMRSCSQANPQPGAIRARRWR